MWTKRSADPFAMPHSSNSAMSPYAYALKMRSLAARKQRIRGTVACHWREACAQRVPVRGPAQ